MISFQPGMSNQLLVNPRLSGSEKSVLTELKNEFGKKFGNKNYFLIPSSGSSQMAGQSVKLIALPLESVLNSAKRVNFYLNAKAEDNWGLFLPSFHVAGLGVLARAYLSGSGVKEAVFGASEFAGTLTENKISFLSLVPAQIFDLIDTGVKAPACVKKVFVGGGFLNESLRGQIKDLGWPVTESYGMTETSSMVALREANAPLFALMPGVSAKTEDGCLLLKCDSLLAAVVQKTGEDVSLLEFDRNSWLRTEDLATLHEKENGSFLELHGRKSDYFKILGEGVSLNELRTKLQEISHQLGLDPRQYELLPIEHDRSGYQMTLVIEESMAHAQQDLVNLFNQTCRPYERIAKTFVLRQIPRTDLGKLKTAELKRIISGI